MSLNLRLAVRSASCSSSTLKHLPSSAASVSEMATLTSRKAGFLKQFPARLRLSHHGQRHDRPQENPFSWTSTLREVETNQCWNCDHKNTVFCLFCEKCEHVLGHDEAREGRLDYFQVLGLPRKFELSKQVLSSSFRALQAKLHPDRFAVATDEEKAISADSSSLVNRAYSVLKDPIARGLHLLELYGKPLEEADKTTNPAFLMTIMEINEEIADNAGSPDVLNRIKEDNDGKIEEYAVKLAAAFDAKDYELARKVLGEMKYFENVRDKLACLGVGME